MKRIPSINEMVFIKKNYSTRVIKLKPEIQRGDLYLIESYVPVFVGREDDQVPLIVVKGRPRAKWEMTHGTYTSTGRYKNFCLCASPKYGYVLIDRDSLVSMEEINGNH